MARRWNRRLSQPRARAGHVRGARLRSRAPQGVSARSSRLWRVRSVEGRARPSRLSLAALRTRMNTVLRDKVVVVTGASSGVGRAAVRELARRGARVGLLARGVDGLAGARADVEAAGARALAVPTDIADAT